MATTLPETPTGPRSRWLLSCLSVCFGLVRIDCLPCCTLSNTSYLGSQVPLYFVGGSLAYIVQDLGGAQAEAWLPVCYTLVLAAICPFVGYLQDMFGRRHMTLGGAITVIVGIALVGSAHSFGQGVAGMCIAGAGAAIGELTALAG